MQTEAAQRTADEVRDLRFQVERTLVMLEAYQREQKAILHKQDAVEIDQALKRGRMALSKGSGDRRNLEEIHVWLKRFYTHLTEKNASSSQIN